MTYNESAYESIYFFVDYPERKKYDTAGKTLYSGSMDLVFTCGTDIHIGSGYRDFTANNKKILVQEVMRMNGKPVIPGSSLKGVVRGIAQAVSKSCNPDWKCKKVIEDRCITCDMFGTMGFGSKVVFSDFVPEKEIKTVEKELNVQFGPQKNKDGKKGYKFYQTVENRYDGAQKTQAELVPAGSEFSGRIFFNRLTEEELCLLTYSLSLNTAKEEGINLKIGGFKNEGLGEIKGRCTDFKVNNNLKKTAGELAAGYRKQNTAVTKNMDDIEDCMRDGD